MLGKFIHDSYAGEWYNGQLEQTPEYIGNKVSMLIGMPRLRQLRIKEGKLPVFFFVFSREPVLLNTGVLDNAIRDFHWLCHYTLSCNWRDL